MVLFLVENEKELGAGDTWLVDTRGGARDKAEANEMTIWLTGKQRN